MALVTRFTERFRVSHPIALAPMGGASGGALAAAVTNAGGLGLIGGGSEKGPWLDAQLEIAEESADGPWGVGFQSWATDRPTVERALRHHPAAVMLAFGDASPLVGPIREAGAALIMQVVDLEEARAALDLGADLIIAQGTEAGGHGGRRTTLSFVPVVVDLAGSTPVLAAGGIADGRGLAAALALGAAGALVGTRFLAAREALIDEAARERILATGGEATERDRLPDIARGTAWPSRYSGRAVAEPFFDSWRGRDDEVAADPDAFRGAYREAIARGELPRATIWASQAIDLVTKTAGAEEIVTSLAAEAEAALARAGRP